MGKASFFEDYLNEKYSDYVEQTVAEVKPEVSPDVLYFYEFRVGWVNPISAPQEYAFFRKIENVFRHSSAVKEFETFCQLGWAAKDFSGKLLRSKSEITYPRYHDEHENDSDFKDNKIQRVIVVRFSLNECSNLQVFLFIYNLLARVCWKFPRTSRFDSCLRTRMRLLHNYEEYHTFWQGELEEFETGKDDYITFRLLELLGHKLESSYVPNDIFGWRYSQKLRKDMVERTKWFNGHYQVRSSIYATEFTCQRYSHLEWLDSINIELNAETWRVLCLKMLIAREALNYIDWFTSGNHSLKRFMNKHLVDETKFTEDVSFYIENYPVHSSFNFGLSNRLYRDTSKKIGQYALDNSRSKKMSQYCKLIENGIDMLQITIDRRRVIIDDSAVPCMMLDFKETEQ